MERAIVTDIQRFSLDDGPGIRTTVFFKGCNLRCTWCHNPETIRPEPEFMTYPDGTRRLCGKSMTVDEVLDTVYRDAAFYRKSGGGVTLSGGEPLLQPDFCAALAGRCREAGVHLIVDTAGDVPFASFEQLLGVTDCFYFDVKTHETGYGAIGGDGKRVYDNLKRLTGLCRVVARIPVIPGFNDTVAEELSESAKALGAGEVQFLPFHGLGSGKYKALGLDYAYTQRDTDSV